ncbi:hypothetical protein BH10CHL1_BH10CHL1_00520 [soil metagenome]
MSPNVTFMDINLIKAHVSGNYKAIVADGILDLLIVFACIHREISRRIR